MQEPGKPILKKPPGYSTDQEAESARVKLPAQRKPAPLYHPKKKSKRRKCCRFCCCCLCVSLLVLILLLGCATGIFYLWFDPKLPTFRLRPVQFTRFSLIKSPEPMSYYLHSQATIWMELKNPNDKITFYYGGTQVMLTSDGDTELGSATVPGFTQDPGNITLLRFVTRSDNTQLIDEGTGKRLSAAVKSGALAVDVGVKTEVKVGLSENLKLGFLPVEVNCGGVTLKQLNDEPPPKCNINVLKW